MKILDDKTLLFFGDNKGQWTSLISILNGPEVRNANIICVGNVGINTKTIANLAPLNNFLECQNVNFYGIRGSKDEESLFNSSSRVCMSNIEMLRDYTLLKHRNKTMQVIGGATDFNPYYRNIDSKLEINFKKCREVDVLVTHLSPLFEYHESSENALIFNSKALLKMNEEKNAVNTFIEKSKPKFYFCGHSLDCKDSVISDCNVKCLKPEEITIFAH